MTTIEKKQRDREWQQCKKAKNNGNNVEEAKRKEWVVAAIIKLAIGH